MWVGQCRDRLRLGTVGSEHYGVGPSNERALRDVIGNRNVLAQFRKMGSKARRTDSGDKGPSWAGILSPPAARRSWLPLRLRLLRRDSKVEGSCCSGLGSPVAFATPLPNPKDARAASIAHEELVVVVSMEFVRVMVCIDCQEVYHYDNVIPASSM